MSTDSLNASFTHLPDFDPSDADEGRRPYFEALDVLKEGDSAAALKAFRRAARVCEPPFDTLSTMAAAECERLLDRAGAALRELKKVAADESLPEELRYVAWLSIARLAESRHDPRSAARAEEALAEMAEMAE